MNSLRFNFPTCILHFYIMCDCYCLYTSSIGACLEQSRIGMLKHKIDLKSFESFRKFYFLDLFN